MRWQKILPLLLMAIISVQSGGQNLILPLYPEGAIPGSKPCNLSEQRDTTDAIRISQVIVPEISIYLPSPRLRTGAAVVICPGGGYRRLAWDWEGEDIARFWNSKGVTAIVLKYRLPLEECQENPENIPLRDVTRALRLTRYHAEEWGLDSSRIGVMGFSAGGHLASTLSTRFDFGHPGDPDPVERQSCRPDFAILIYPVITMSAEFMHKGSRDALVGDDKDLALFYSNELHVGTGTPPTFLVHASDDKSVPVENSLSYYRALVKAGVTAEMHVFPYGGHAFSLAVGRGHLDEWPELCNSWLLSLKEE